MDPEILKEVYHWIPAPILTAAVIFFFRQWLQGHENKLTGIVGRLEAATTRVGAHDSAIDRLTFRLERHERDCEKRQAETDRTRDRLADLAEELQALRGRLEGSGPKRWPRSDDEG